MMMERMTTDINALKQQYSRIKKKQQQQVHQVYIRAGNVVFGTISSLCHLVEERTSAPRTASSWQLAVAQQPQTRLARADSTFGISFFILSGPAEEKVHGFLLGTKNQAADGSKHIFTLCACGEG